MKRFKAGDIELLEIGECKWEIPKSQDMQVPGVVYADEDMLEKISEDRSLYQVINVASLPGIVKASIAMPDIHWGYGMPVGGIAAFPFNEDGIVGPGMVGYDINCGVRVHSTNLTVNEIKDKIEKISQKLYDMVPAGVGIGGNVKLDKRKMEKFSTEGVRYAVELGYGSFEDVKSVESEGCVEGANFDYVSQKAYDRGRDQLGTLGSGNHFVEIGYVEEIYMENIAKEWGFEKGMVTVLIHSGSRGFGHQICDDYLKEFSKWCAKNNIKLKDRQLVWSFLNTQESKRYLAAMNCAINYAFVNRFIIAHFVKEALKSSLGKNIEMKLLYDVAHNTAKIEEHTVNGKKEKLLVHRKGATRAFPKDNPLLPEKHKKFGQPVIIPGDMGRYSYVLLGTEKAMEETWGTVCHGAGRVLSRSKAIKMAKGRNIQRELQEVGITVKARETELLAEEMSEAYKDVSQVVDVCEKAGVSLKVLRLKPLAVIKG